MIWVYLFIWLFFSQYTKQGDNGAMMQEANGKENENTEPETHYSEKIKG